MPSSVRVKNWSMWMDDLNEVKIVSSNSYTLAAQVQDCGAIPVQLGIAKDRKEEIKEKLLQGLRADVSSLQQEFL